MTNRTLGIAQSSLSIANHVYQTLMQRQRLLTTFAVVMLLLAIHTTLLLALDDRTLRDVAIWAKPLKFMLSTCLYAVTTAWFVGLLPKDLQTSPLINKLALTIVITASFEVCYISLQAALGQGSHYNTGDTLHALLFGLMAIAAVGLTATQAVLAWLISQYSPARKTPFGRAVIIGLTLTFLLSTASGFMLGGQQPPPGVGLPIVGWHLGLPDARPAHFLGVHANQIIPLAGYLLQRYPRKQARRWLGGFTTSYLLAWALLTGWALA